MWLCLRVVGLLTIWWVLAAGPVFGLEVTSDINRYRGYEVSTGRYEDREVKPEKAYRRFIEPTVSPRKGVVTLAPGAAQVRVRTRLADSHMGLKFYNDLSCLACHPGQDKKNLHVYREKLACRQCHGPEPISSLNHYYSPMNPIRRHAYVCAKCHEGADASFATFVAHVPDPQQAATADVFPAVYYAYWLLAILTIGTLVLFIPHTVLWTVREFFRRRPSGRSSP